MDKYCTPPSFWRPLLFQTWKSSSFSWCLTAPSFKVTVWLLPVCITYQSRFCAHSISTLLNCVPKRPKLCALLGGAFGNSFLELTSSWGAVSEKVLKTHFKEEKFHKFPFLEVTSRGAVSSDAPFKCYMLPNLGRGTQTVMYLPMVLHCFRLRVIYLLCSPMHGESSQPQSKTIRS